MAEKLEENPPHDMAGYGGMIWRDHVVGNNAWLFQDIAASLNMSQGFSLAAEGAIGTVTRRISMASPRAVTMCGTLDMGSSEQTGCITRTNWSYPLPFFLSTRAYPISPDHISRSQCDGSLYLTLTLTVGAPTPTLQEFANKELRARNAHHPQNSVTNDS